MTDGLLGDIIGASVGLFALGTVASIADPTLRSRKRLTKKERERAESNKLEFRPVF